VVSRQLHNQASTSTSQYTGAADHFSLAGLNVWGLSVLSGIVAGLAASAGFNLIAFLEHTSAPDHLHVALARPAAVTDVMAEDTAGLGTPSIRARKAREVA
jgi:hypothetical protein